MEIKLKVIAYDQKPLDKEISAVFGDEGGSIGRAEHNTLTLPDELGYVSRVHANVIKQGEQFSLVDCSSNGTYLFNVEPVTNQHAGEIILQNSASPLHIGSHINIGGFEIEVLAMDANTDADDTQEITQENPVDDSTDPNFNTPLMVNSIPEQSNQEHYEFEALIGVEPIAESYKPPEINQEALNSDADMPETFAIDDFFADKTSERFSAQSVSEIPESAQVQNSEAAEPLPKQTENLVPPAEQQIQNADPEVKTSVDDEFEVFFQSLGMQPGQYPADKQQALAIAGDMLRILLNGTLALMQGRAEIKREIDAQVTGLQKEQNNPLKFCQTLEELLPYLFNQQAPGFVPPLQAVKDCQAELLSHQLAMMAGIQAGLQMTIDKFNPALIESLLADTRFNKQAKCWERYVQDFPETAKRVKDEFFGEAFKEAYVRQVRKIKQN